MAEISKEVRNKIQKEVLAYPKTWTHGICAYKAFLRDSGKNHSIPYRTTTTGDICHAGVSSLPNECILVNAHKPAWSKKNPEFLRWCARESPFSHGVINRDNEKEIFNHASVIDLQEVNKGGALWLCKAFRHFEENSFILNTWDKLRNEGLDGFQAFIGADILLETGLPAFNNTHVSLFAYDTPSNLRKWYDEIRTARKLANTNVNRGDYNYGRVNGAKNWGCMQGKARRKSDGWGGFTEILEPGSPKDYAACLKEIFTGDPKNVK